MQPPDRGWPDVQQMERCACLLRTASPAAVAVRWSCLELLRGSRADRMPLLWPPRSAPHREGLRNTHRPFELGNAASLCEKVSADAERPGRSREVTGPTDDGLIVDQIAIPGGAVRGSILDEESPAVVRELRIGHHRVPGNEDDRRSRGVRRRNEGGSAEPRLAFEVAEHPGDGAEADRGSTGRRRDERFF